MSTPHEMPSTKNGNVTALAVLQFVWAPVGLLAGLGMALGGAVLGAIGSEAGGQFGWLGAAAGVFFIVWGVLYLIMAALAITAGVNLLRYKPLGRTLTFVTAGFAGLDGLLALVSVILGNVFGIVSMILPLGFAIYAFIALTRPGVVALLRGEDAAQNGIVVEMA